MKNGVIIMIMTILSGLWIVLKAAIVIYLCMLTIVFAGSFCLKLIKSFVSVIASIFGVNSDVGILSHEEHYKIRKDRQLNKTKKSAGKEDKKNKEDLSDISSPLVDIPRMR